MDESVEMEVSMEALSGEASQISGNLVVDEESTNSLHQEVGDGDEDGDAVGNDGEDLGGCRGDHRRGFAVKLHCRKAGKVADAITSATIRFDVEIVAISQPMATASIKVPKFET